MARTATVIYQGNLTITETADTTTSPSSGSNGSFRVYDAHNTTSTLTTSGTPAVSGDIVDISRTLSGTSTSIDLTAAPMARDVAETADMTGKKLVSIILKADSGNNAAGIVIKPHGTNGYNLFGTSGQITLYPNGRLVMSLVNGGTPQTPAVAGAAKVIELTHTNGDIIGGILVFA